MVDRQVLQIRPRQSENPRSQLFSTFAAQANIVLLGDPGAGKTHLFQTASEREDAQFLRARDFLNLPVSAFTSRITLFIDGLDERRAGRGDQGTIDRMVQKLFEVMPPKVRISCREQDWLGDTDLAAFQPYFDRSGGAVVVSLRSLSDGEQRDLLIANGMEAAATDAFLIEAVSRGLADYLGNPQNLLMLAQAVRQGRWPETRQELFDISAQIMLSEHSSERSRNGQGVFTPDELRDAAGACCAIRLISDVAGISLTEASSDPSLPSYRGLSFLDL